jgi:hypothetical protein
MDDIKSWWQSRTVWGAVLAILAPLLAKYGYAIDPALQADLVTAILTVFGAAGGVLAIIGRVKATKTIGGTAAPTGTLPGLLLAAGLLGSLTLGGPIACSAVVAQHDDATPAQTVYAVTADYTGLADGAAALIGTGTLPAATTEALRAADRVAFAALGDARLALTTGDPPAVAAALAAARQAVAELSRVYLRAKGA